MRWFAICKFFALIAVSAVVHEVIASDSNSCHCGTAESFHSLCNQISKVKDKAHESVFFFACYCLCPGKNVEVIYPHITPSPRDLYHWDQIKFLNDVSHHPNFTKSIVVYTSTGDESTMDIEVRKLMFKIGQPFLSHAHNISLGGEPSHLFFIPDHLFIRNQGYTGLVTKLRKAGLPLEGRDASCFWRGSATAPIYGSVDNPRYRMCLAAKNVTWLNMGITKTFNGQAQAVYSREDILKPFVGEDDWIRYRGIVDIDGSVNAWGLSWRLGSGSVVFKVESNITNHQIRSMKPYVHYIPLRADMSDFASTTKYVTEDRSIPFLRAITENAYELYKKHSYKAEVDRVALELQQFVILHEETAASGDIDVTSFRGQLLWAHGQVNRLLKRLNAEPREVRMEEKTIRFVREEFEEAFPEFLLDMFSTHPESCFPQKEADLCPVFTKIPKLATYRSPADFFNGSASNVLSMSADDVLYYGPQNVRQVTETLLPVYKSDERCNYDNYYETSMYKKRSAGHEPRNVNPDCPKSRHMIFTMAEKYSCNKYSMYLKSLRDVGVCADVFIVAADANYRPCRQVEESCGKVVILPINAKYKEIPIEIVRFLVPLEYLNEFVFRTALSETATAADVASLLCTQVMITDFGDVYFQRNPFTSFLYKVDAELVYTEESFDDKGVQTTIWDETTKRHMPWVKAVSEQVFGSDVSDKIGSMPMINGGVGLGTLGGMYKYLWVMAYILDLVDATQPGITMQGTLNFAVYAGFLSKVVRTRILSPSVSPFLTGGYHHPAVLHAGQPYNFQTNPMVNELQLPYSVIHAYTRYHMMLICEDFVLNYGGMDWRFKAVAPAKECVARDSGAMSNKSSSSSNSMGYQLRH